jgi:hypothetical protein
METLDKNEDLDLVELSIGKDHIGSKWVFKNKMNTEGKLEKCKAWLVAKIYSQVEGIYFGEIFFFCCQVNLYNIYVICCCCI